MDRVIIDINPVTVRRPAISVRPMTVVVVGAFRGGTSFVAEALVKLGVPMGGEYAEVVPTPNYVSYEDSEVGLAIDHKDFSALKTLIADRNSLHEVWGFKKPSSVFIIDQLLSMIRNPHIIVVVRDPLACYQSSKAHELNNKSRMPIKRCRDQHSAVMDCVERPRCPTLAISYERGKAAPEKVTEAIKSFLFL